MSRQSDKELAECILVRESPRLKTSRHTIAKRENVMRLYYNNPKLSAEEIAKKTYNGSIDNLDHLDDVSYEGEAKGIRHARPFYAYLGKLSMDSGGQSP